MFFDSVPFDEFEETIEEAYGLTLGGTATITGGAYIPPTEGGLSVSGFPKRYRRKIKIGPVAADLKDFVVPVSCRAGSDVVFFDTRGNRLWHEVRKPDYYMVRLDLESEGTDFYIYY